MRLLLNVVVYYVFLSKLIKNIIFAFAYKIDLHKLQKKIHM